jgi:hypothetical protein
MKIFIPLLLLLTITIFSYGQKEFVGVAKYRMAVVGGPDEDSIAIVFDKNRILVTLYAPSHEDPKKIHEIAIINDFSKNKQYTLNKIEKTYKTDTLINTVGYDFIDTKKTMIVKGTVCFHYKADSSKIDKSNMLRADCLAAIDYMNESIKNFWFMGFQPIIVDSKIVMDFIVTEPDGSKPRVYISGIVALKSVAEYFDLTGYKEVK